MSPILKLVNEVMDGRGKNSPERREESNVDTRRK
jgi:hypothetical protein